MSDKNAEKDVLRAEAEAVIARKPIALVNPQPGEEHLHKLLHELQVHQVELKMQNDELRQAQIAMEESRDRYADLYDFAPIGYLTLSREGMISEINLTAAEMLGAVRKQLVSRRFSQFVAEEDRERWDRHFVSILQHGQRQRCELSIRRDDGSIIHAQIDSVNCCELEKSALLETKSDWVSAVRVALSDITERIQNEAALRNAHGLAECIMDIVHEPLLVLDSTMTVVSASRSFFNSFQVTQEETVGRQIYELGRYQWDIPKLRNLLEITLQGKQAVEGFEVQHDFPVIGKRKMLLNARCITGKTDGTQLILLVIENIAGVSEW
jgi:PAS domain S-box-containing protein